MLPFNSDKKAPFIRIACRINDTEKEVILNADKKMQLRLLNEFFIIQK